MDPKMAQRILKNAEHPRKLTYLYQKLNFMAISGWVGRQTAEGPPMLKLRRVSSKPARRRQTKSTTKREQTKKSTQKPSLQVDFSDIDEVDLTLIPEGFDLLRESRSRKKPKTKFVSSPFRRNEGGLSAKLPRDVDSNRLL